MKFEKSTRMTLRRIVISLLIYLLVPVLRTVVRHFIGNDTLSMMFALNVSAWLMVMYDWELFGLHWNRAKNALADTTLYTVIGIIIFFMWIFINNNYLHGQMVIPDVAAFQAYPIAIPAILFAFSVSLSIVVNITFKCLTDHFKVHAREATMILLSGFLFGLIYTLTMTPFRLSSFVQTYLYNIITISLLSYLYNQTHSILPGMISQAVVLLIWQILLFI